MTTPPLPGAVMPTPLPVAEPSAGSEWRLYWPLLLVGVACMMLMTMQVYTLGVMVGPLEQEFGWSRTQIFTGPLIFAVVGGVIAPITGTYVDKIGPRKIGLVAVPLMCLTNGMLSLATAWPPSWWILWFLVSTSVAIGGPTLWTAGVNSRFVHNRGLALAIILCGTGLGSAIIPASTQWLVEQVGWRQAYVVVAAAGALISFPLVFFLFKSPADRPRVVVREDAAINAAVLRQVYLSRRFLMLMFGIALFAFPVSAVIVNAVPLLTGNGFARSSAAQLAGLLGIGAIIGRICGGFLLDRLHANRVTAVCLMMPAITCAILLAFPQSSTAVAIALLIMGLSLGAEMDACAYLTAQYFGMRNFGKLFGLICGMLALSNGLAPMGAGFVYDSTGSYVPVLWAVIPATLLSGLLVFGMGRAPEKLAEA